MKIVTSAQPLEDQLTSEQKITWDNVKQGFIELKLAEEGKMEFRPVEDVINEL